MKKIMLVILINFAFGQDTTGLLKPGGTWESIKKNPNQNLNIIGGGQEISFSEMPFSYTEFAIEDELFIEKGLLNFRYNDIKTHIVTTRSYEIYAEECYNDSFKIHTYNTFYTTQWNNSCYEQTGNLMLGYEPKLACENSEHFEYHHIKPTLEGFIEWFKKEGKQ